MKCIQPTSTSRTPIEGANANHLLASSLRTGHQGRGVIHRRRQPVDPGQRRPSGEPHDHGFRASGQLRGQGRPPSIWLQDLSADTCMRRMEWCLELT